MNTKTTKSENLSNPLERIKSAISARFGRNCPVPEETNNLEALAKMNERSVCRDYSNKPLSEGLLETLCATALSAPSKSDLQQASIIRVVSKESRRALHNLLPQSSWMVSAPEFLVICGDHSRMQHSFELREASFPNNHLDSFFNASVDAGILLATLLQAAQFAGIGACPVSEIRDQIEEVSAILELPKWVFPIAGITLGYPASIEPMSPRLGFEATVHTDVYDSSNMTKKITSYDSRRNSTRPFNSQRDTSHFGKALNYGWSEDKFRQYSKIQRENFGHYIKKQGFNLD